MTRRPPTDPTARWPEMRRKRGERKLERALRVAESMTDTLRMALREVQENRDAVTRRNAVSAFTTRVKRLCGQLAGML